MLRMFIFQNSHKEESLEYNIYFSLQIGSKSRENFIRLESRNY